MAKNKLALIILFVISSCGQQQEKPIVYDAVTIDKVCEKDGKGELLHRYVQVEGFLSMPSSIFSMSGGGTWVTLYEAPNNGQSVETSIRVDSTGRNRLISKAYLYDEETLKIADKDGNLLKFSDKVLIQGSLRLNTKTGKSSDCYIDIDIIQRSSTPDDIPLYRPVNKQINEAFNFGGIDYVVRSARFTKTVGNEFNATTANGFFLIAEIEIKNTTDESAYTSEEIRLKDTEGTEYSISPEGESALFMSGLSGDIFVSIEPHQSKKKVLIFDVPGKKTCYLHIAQHTGRSKSAIVTIPGN